MVRIGIHQGGIALEFGIDFRHFAAHRRVNIARRFDRLDDGRSLSRFQYGANLRELHVNDVGQFRLGVIRNSYGANRAQNKHGQRCGELYGIEFPLTEPMHVRFEPDGLWRELATQPGSGAPVWNFNKYLVAGDGRVAGWWSTNVEPHHARIREAVELELVNAQIRRPSLRTPR